MKFHGRDGGRGGELEDHDFYTCRDYSVFSIIKLISFIYYQHQIDDYRVCLAFSGEINSQVKFISNTFQFPLSYKSSYLLSHEVAANECCTPVGNV